ncbi:MAG: hypothetical protein [Anelloviridae sp.]|nr:MAG: hypothetical protein [Anelloviridae sp.]
MLHHLTSLTQIRYRVQRSQLKASSTNLIGDETKLLKKLHNESLKTSHLENIYLQMQQAVQQKYPSSKHTKKSSCRRRRRKPKRKHYSSSSTDSDSSKRTSDTESDSS